LTDPLLLPLPLPLRRPHRRSSPLLLVHRPTRQPQQPPLLFSRSPAPAPLSVLSLAVPTFAVSELSRLLSPSSQCSADTPSLGRRWPLSCSSPLRGPWPASPLLPSPLPSVCRRSSSDPPSSSPLSPVFCMRIAPLLCCPPVSPLSLSLSLSLCPASPLLRFSSALTLVRRPPLSPPSVLLRGDCQHTSPVLQSSSLSAPLCSRHENE
jgi:hypothetical protein